MKAFVDVPSGNEIFDSFLPHSVREYLEKNFETEYLAPNERYDAAGFCERVKDADIIITGWGHPQNTGEMTENTDIKLIAHTGGSVGSLVTPGVYENGVRVISGNIMYAKSVAEGVIAYILTGLRRIPDYIERVRSGGWRNEGECFKGLLDRSVGIIGFGSIATQLVKMLQPFDVKTKVYSKFPVSKEILEAYNISQVTLEEALGCDIVTLHSAMTERTRGLIGREQFELIRNGALFINTARGRIVDEKAMTEALKKNYFSAVLDVYYDEPLKADSELRKLKNVYCIPHMAGPTIDRRPLITKRLIDDMIAFTQGKKMELEISKEYAARMTVGG